MEASGKKSSLAVIKVGGDILLDEEQKTGLGDNIRSLIEQGWQVIVLHGGGPQLSDMQARRGIEPRKIGGRRITSKEDLQLVKQVLCGEVNVDLVASLQSQGVNALGCHGASGQIIQAVKRPPRIVSGSGPEPIDFGEVGDVVSVNRSLLHNLTDIGLVPVIASLGISGEGDIFNINADTTVVKIARQLPADLLIFVTGIGGIYQDIKDPGSRFASLNQTLAKQYIDRGVIVDGMIPKVEEALSLLESGVDAIVIVDTRKPEAFSSIARGESSYGTRIIA